MTAYEWKSSQSLVQWMHAVQSSKEWSILMELFEREHPKGIRTGQELEHPSIALGRIWGYHECVELLKNLGTPNPLPSKQLEPTFEPPEQ